MKHVRDIISGIQALAPGVEVEVVRQRVHVILRVTYAGSHRTIPVASSPRDYDHCIRKTVRDAKQAFNL